MKKKILSLGLAIAMTFSMSVNTFATDGNVASEGFGTSVLAAAELATEDIVYDEVASTDVYQTTEWIGEDDTAALELIGVGVPETTTVETVVSENAGTYEKIYLNENDYICVDENNEIFRISNFGSESEVVATAAVVDGEDSTVDETAISEQICDLLNLSSEYVLENVEDFDSDYVILTMSKSYSGIMNPYESVNAVIRKSDSSVVYLRFFDTAPETTAATISAEEALSAAANIVVDLGAEVTATNLVYTKPNYYWYNGTETDYEIADFVRLAYRITLGAGDWFIEVDAVTGEVIGGDMSMAEKAGCYGQTDTNYYKGATTTNLAVAGYKKLGYTTSSQTSDTGSVLRSTVTSFMSGSTAYGLYIRAHGSEANSNGVQLLATKVGESYSSFLYTYDVSGNWHFVFLDACHTADSSNWANCFNISSSYSNRAYLGWYGTVTTGNSYLFAVEFWPLVGTMSIRNAAVAAAAEVEGSGTTPIRFYGDTSYYGTAWS